MIELGIITKGRRLLDRPVGLAVHRLLVTLRQQQGAPSVELVYVIPGELGKADFDGFELAWRREPARRPIVYIDVPSELVEASVEPTREVLDLAWEALEFARGKLGDQLDARTLEAARQQLNEVEALVLPGQASRAAGARDRWTSEASQGDPGPPSSTSSLEVSLQTPAQQAVDAAFALEDRLGSALREMGAGEVDGNEVGQGEFRIFVHGNSWRTLWEVVVPIVETDWAYGEALIRAFDGEDEVERRHL